MYAWGGTLDNIANHPNPQDISYQNSRPGINGGNIPAGGNDLSLMLLDADSVVASNPRQLVNFTKKLKK